MSILAISVFWKTLPVVVVTVGAGWWAIRRFRLPFVGGLFWKTLAVVAAAVTVAWTLVFTLTEYEIMPADYGGTIISTLIFSYLVHLWIMPHDDLNPEESDGGAPEQSEN